MNNKNISPALHFLIYRYSTHWSQCLLLSFNLDFLFAQHYIKLFNKEHKSTFLNVGTSNVAVLAVYLMYKSMYYGERVYRRDSNNSRNRKYLPSWMSNR